MNKLLISAAAAGLLGLAGTGQAQSVGVTGAVNGAAGAVAGSTRDHAGVNRTTVDRTVNSASRTATGKNATTETRRGARTPEVDTHTKARVERTETPVGDVRTAERAGGHVDADPR